MRREAEQVNVSKGNYHLRKTKYLIESGTEKRKQVQASLKAFVVKIIRKNKEIIVMKISED